MDTRPQQSITLELTPSDRQALATVVQERIDYLQTLIDDGESSESVLDEADALTRVHAALHP